MGLVDPWGLRICPASPPALYFTKKIVTSILKKVLFMQDIEREIRKKENPEAMEEDDTEEIVEIRACHFMESMKYAHRSVSDAEIRKY